MREWSWANEFGRFSLRLDAGAFTLTVDATQRGAHEMGWSTGSFPVTLDALAGDVPVDILAQVRGRSAGVLIGCRLLAPEGGRWPSGQAVTVVGLMGIAPRRLRRTSRSRRGSIREGGR